jgi:hypothetical protein
MTEGHEPTAVPSERLRQRFTKRLLHSARSWRFGSERQMASVAGLRLSSANGKDPRRQALTQATRRRSAARAAVISDIIADGVNGLAITLARGGSGLDFAKYA